MGTAMGWAGARGKARGAMPAAAALKNGEKAPDFSAKASLAGKEFNFSLPDALKKGPAVVYFYPSAYTRGCDLEAHTFAVNKEKFDAAKATIVAAGFSSRACASRAFRIAGLLASASMISVIVAPARTSKSIIDKLNAVMIKELHAPDVLQRFEKNGLEVAINTPVEFRAMIAADLAMHLPGEEDH